MSMSRTKAALAALTVLIVAVGCATTKSSGPQYSGWLKDYSGMTEQKDSLGNTVMRYVNPNLTQDKYNALLVEPVTYYPEPQTTAQVSAQALDNLAAYMTAQVKQELIAKGVKVVDAPGKGIVRVRMAITSVGVKVEGRSAYQYIPQAFIVSAAYRAGAGDPYQGALRVEVEATDSVTGERLLVTVRSGVGEALGRARSEANAPVLTVDSVKKVVDGWADAGAAQVAAWFNNKQ
jgi:Protein of unknown function (DUF3313)